MSVDSVKAAEVRLRRRHQRHQPAQQLLRRDDEARAALCFGQNANLLTIGQLPAAQCDSSRQHVGENGQPACRKTQDS